MSAALTSLFSSSSVEDGVVRLGVGDQGGDRLADFAADGAFRPVLRIDRLPAAMRPTLELERMVTKRGPMAAITL